MIDRDSIRRRVEGAKRDGYLCGSYKDVCKFAAQASLDRAALLDEIERLAREIATEREKFTMHTARVHAWFSALLQELGIASEGDTIDVATACSKAMDKVAELRAALRARGGGE